MGQIINTSIITIGDELLIGQVIDTNSAWIAQQLNAVGMHVSHRIAVGDVWDDIWEALDIESKRSQIILITGGLGPTADDITKPLLCKYFGGKMVMDGPTLEHVTYLFEKVFNRPMPLLERNRKQAEVPDVATILKNERGTAPGMLFEKDGKVFISMPGVPHEMKGIMTDHVIPLLLNRFDPGDIEHRTLMTFGIGESFLAERIKDWEEALPAHVKLAYLPNNSMLRLRLTGRGPDAVILKKEVDDLFASLQALIPDVMIANEDITLVELVGKLLRERKQMVATAESCTGGYVAHLLTTMPGSSAFYTGSVVSYTNGVKHDVLHVAEETLKTVGAVSEATVIQMAENARKLMKTDYAVSISGIMGPDGGTPDKPVGTVWIAVAGEKRTETKQFQFRYDRRRNIEMTAINALNLLRLFILQAD